MKRLPILALAVLLGCGGDNNSVAPPETLVAGTWRFTYTNLTGSVQGIGVSCAPVELDFSITQGLFTFSGVQVGTGTVTCSTNAAVLVSQVITGETIVQGQIQGSSIAFGFGTMSGVQTGIVGRTSINGTSQWLLQGNGVTLLLTGQFTAVRL
jgi:hypothetical protein